MRLHVFHRDHGTYNQQCRQCAGLPESVSNDVVTVPFNPNALTSLEFTGHCDNRFALSGANGLSTQKAGKIRQRW